MNDGSRKTPNGGGDWVGEWGIGVCFYVLRTLRVRNRRERGALRKRGNRFAQVWNIERTSLVEIRWSLLGICTPSEEQRTPAIDRKFSPSNRFEFVFGMNHNKIATNKVNSPNKCLATNKQTNCNAYGTNKNTNISHNCTKSTKSKQS